MTAAFQGERVFKVSPFFPARFINFCPCDDRGLSTMSSREDRPPYSWPSYNASLLQPIFFSQAAPDIFFCHDLYFSTRLDRQMGTKLFNRPAQPKVKFYLIKNEASIPK